MSYKLLDITPDIVLQDYYPGRNTRLLNNIKRIHANPPSSPLSISVKSSGGFCVDYIAYPSMTRVTGGIIILEK